MALEIKVYISHMTNISLEGISGLARRLHITSELLSFHSAILCISSCLSRHGPRWQHHHYHHICGPDRKKEKNKGKKIFTGLLIWFIYLVSLKKKKKRKPFPRCLTRWLSFISHWPIWGHMATPFTYKGIWEM